VKTRTTTRPRNNWGAGILPVDLCYQASAIGTRILLLVVAIAALTCATSTTAQVDEAPYFGDWENNRGDTLQITAAAIQVNKEKPARYDDITEDSDEQSFFVLQIKDLTALSYFGGNFLRITFGKDPDHFTMSIYKTLPDTLKQQNEVKRIEWSAPAEEKEEVTSEQKDQPKEQENKEEPKKDQEKNANQSKDDQGQEKPTPSATATASPSSP